MESRFKISDVALRILIGYLGVVIMLTFIMIVADTNMARSQRAIESSSRIYVPRMNIANSIKSIVQEQQMLARDFETGRVDIKIKYRELDRLFFKRVGEFKELVASDTDSAAIQLRRVEREHANFNLVANHIFKYKEAGRESLVKTLLINYYLAGGKMIKTANDLVGDSMAHIKDAQTEGEQTLDRSRSIMYTIAFISIVTCFALTYITSTNITKPLHRLVAVSGSIAGGDLTRDVEDNSIGEFGELAKSFNTMVDNLRAIVENVVGTSRRMLYASESFAAHMQQSAATYEVISGSIAGVSDGARQQADGITELRTAAGMVTGAIQNITDSIQTIKRTTFSANEVAVEGEVSVDGAVRQMKVIAETVESLEGTIKELDSDVKHISDIINMIFGFAKQTNLLALNAAIEAARAGEQGKGFAVVAEEVRNLATGSSQLVDKIRQIIAGIQQRSDVAVAAIEHGKQVVSEGTVVINTAGESLKKIIRAVQSASDQTKAVSSATGQISASSDNMMREISINEGIANKTVETSGEMIKLMESQSQAVNQLFRGARDLANLAHELQKAVSRFKIN
jgi:methyl-accepting chemotaxis protein